MDLTRFLSLLVLLTLIFAIARQLSEQTDIYPIYNDDESHVDDGFKDERENIYSLPDSFGIPYANRGWDQGKR